MDILNPRAAFVSAHEVLLHLRTLQPELALVERAHTEKFDRQRKIREDPALRGTLVESELERKYIDREQLFGLKSVVDTGIAHFSEGELTTARQSTAANQQLSRDLQQLDKFTKIEILQIIDLSPRTPVELYTIVEELFDRLDEDEVASVLTLVRASLEALPTAAGSGAAAAAAAAKARVAANGFGTMEGDDDEDEDEEGVYGGDMWDADMEQGGDETYEIDEVDA